MKVLAAIVLGWFGLASAVALAQAPPTPPPTPPAPSVVTPPLTPATAVPAPAPAPVPAAAPAPAANGNGAKDEKKPASPYEIVLGNEQHGITPCTHGAAKVEEGKIEVTVKDNSLKATLAGGAGANVFVGVDSWAEQYLTVTQEFEVKSNDPKITQVVLTVDSALIGFVRIKHKASACVTLASITISPVGWPSAPIYVCHPLPCVGGPNGHCVGPQGCMNKDPLPTFTSQPLPVGNYVLKADFQLQATAGGVLDGHSTAIFSSEPKELDPWEREHDVFKGEDKADFGFNTVITANPVDGPVVADAWKVWKKKKVARRNGNRDTQFVGAVPPPPVR